MCRVPLDMGWGDTKHAVGERHVALVGPEDPLTVARRVVDERDVHLSVGLGRRPHWRAKKRQSESERERERERGRARETMVSVGE